MDMEIPTKPKTNPKKLAKKVCSFLRTILTMVQKTSISKANLIMSLKKANHLATKAINSLLLHHNSLICLPNRPSNHFFSPSKMDYQFSCDNSPAVGPYLVRMAHHHRPKPKSRSKSRPNYHLEDPTTVAVVHQILEMINNAEGPTGSSLDMGAGIDYFLPGFGTGKSPMAKQLRVTDSPFPIKDKKREFEEDIKVSKKAEEFIKKFYNDLRMQKSHESPYHMWAR